jgi:tetratricopeptide (TPR) repeat protein
MKKTLIERGFKSPAEIGVRRRFVFFKQLEKNDVIAYIRAWNANGQQARSRWWLTRIDGQWFVYDAEDLDGGMRWTSVMAAGMQGDQDQNLALARGLRAAMQALAQADGDAALQALEPFRGKRFPDDLAYAQHLMRGVAHILKRDYAAAYVELDWAGEIKPDVPMVDLLKSRISFETGDYAAAIAFADHAIQTLGADVEALHWKGNALYKLNRRDEALAAFGAALDDDPDSASTLADFTLCLTEGRRDEAARRFARSSMTPELLNAVTTQLASPADSNVLASVHRAYREAHPEDAPAPAATNPAPSR